MTENTYQLQISLKAFEYYFIEKAHKEINQMILLFKKNGNEEILDRRSRASLEDRRSQVSLEDRRSHALREDAKTHKFLNQNSETTQSTKFNNVRFNKCTLPLKILRYTVIRSPHIDKKARDQFEIRQHKVVLKHKGHWSSQNVRIFLENLKHASFNGVQIQLKVVSISCGPTKNKNLAS